MIEYLTPYEIYEKWKNIFEDLLKDSKSTNPLTKCRDEILIQLISCINDMNNENMAPSYYSNLEGIFKGLMISLNIVEENIK